MDFWRRPTRCRELREAAKAADNRGAATGRPAGLRIGLQLLRDQRPDAGPRRADPGQARRARAAARAQRQRHRDPQPGLAGTCLQGRGARRQPGAAPAEVPVLWLGNGERISAIVEMKRPGIWVLGDTNDEDRGRGMGIVVEYAGRKGKPQWQAPKPLPLGLPAASAPPSATAASADETLELTFAATAWRARRLQRVHHQRRRVLDGQDGTDVPSRHAASAIGCTCATPPTTFIRSTCTGTASS